MATIKEQNNITIDTNKCAGQNIPKYGDSILTESNLCTKICKWAWLTIYIHGPNEPGSLFTDIW